MNKTLAVLASVLFGAGILMAQLPNPLGLPDPLGITDHPDGARRAEGRQRQAPPSRRYRRDRERERRHDRREERRHHDRHDRH